MAGMLSFGSFSAKDNAVLFVEKYYKALVERPQSAAQCFYEERISSVKLNDGASEKTASTLASINGLLLSLQYTRVVIENIKCEESLKNGVLFVKVAALAETKNDAKKRFTQAFLIAPLIQGYKLVRDMVQYLDPVEEAKTDVKDEVSSTSSSVVQTEESHVLKLKSAQPETVKDEVSSSSSSSSVVEQESVENPSKFTFSRMVKVDAPKDSETEAVASMPAAVERVPKAAAPQKQKEVSVYVKNLPKGSSKSDVLAMFKSFGRIMEDGVFVKTNLDSGFCYGFVDFEDAEAAGKAVQASPLRRKSDGWQVSVELKRQNTAPPPSRRPSSASVRVKNLPEDSSKSDVLVVFEKFGRIKEGGVNPDSTGFGYWVVDFEDAEAAGQAVHTKQVTLPGGWRVNVNVDYVNVDLNKQKPSTGPSSRGRRRNTPNAGRQSGRTN